MNAFTAYIPGPTCGQDHKINMLSAACSLVHVDPAYKHLTGKSGRAKSSEVEWNFSGNRNRIKCFHLLFFGYFGPLFALSLCYTCNACNTCLGVNAFCSARFFPSFSPFLWPNSHPCIYEPKVNFSTNPCPKHFSSIIIIIQLFNE